MEPPSRATSSTASATASAPTASPPTTLRGRVEAQPRARAGRALLPRRLAARRGLGARPQARAWPGHERQGRGHPGCVGERQAARPGQVCAGQRMRGPRRLRVRQDGGHVDAGEPAHSGAMTVMSLWQDNHFVKFADAIPVPPMNDRSRPCSMPPSFGRTTFKPSMVPTPRTNRPT
jgi:hypothetical protein